MRVEYSESIDALLAFGRSLVASCGTMYPCYPFVIYSPEFFSMGLKVLEWRSFHNQTAENLSLRQSVLKSVSQMLQMDPVKTASIVTPMVCDSEGCNVLWSIATLSNKEAVEVMQRGISFVIRKMGTEALLLFYNSLNDYVGVAPIAPFHPRNVRWTWIRAI